MSSRLIYPGTPIQTTTQYSGNFVYNGRFCYWLPDETAAVIEFDEHTIHGYVGSWRENLRGDEFAVIGFTDDLHEDHYERGLFE